MNNNIKRLEPTAEPRQWGLDDETLATRPTVFRDGLLDGKVFIVSGGGSGIGRGITYLLARLGADVMICGRRLEKLEETAGGIKRLLGRDVATCAMTIREPDLPALEPVPGRELGDDRSQRLLGRRRSARHGRRELALLRRVGAPGPVHR